jgi:hypothetical protein
MHTPLKHDDHHKKGHTMVCHSGPPTYGVWVWVGVGVSVGSVLGVGIGVGVGVGVGLGSPYRSGLVCHSGPWSFANVGQGRL